MLNKNKFISSVLMVSSSLSFLFACSPSANPVQPKPQPTVQSPSPAPSESPKPETSPVPSESASPTPTESTSPVPSETVSPESSATPATDISTDATTTLNGMVFDDFNTAMDNVTVRVRSLNSSRPFQIQTETRGGAYVLNAVPAGTQLEITAQKPGFTTRTLVKVLKSNKDGDPNANRHDFGTNGSASNFGINYNALSDKPEVVSVTPGRNATGIDGKADIVMTFSEPMNKDTVLKNFQIRAYTTEQLSVDNGPTYTGANSLTSPEAGSKVWDESAFKATWNNDDSQLTLSFLDDRALPSDKKADNTPEYMISLQATNGQIKDKAGIFRNNLHFKLTTGNFEEAYKFSILTDTAKPVAEKLTALTYENGAADGDVLKLTYSERMIHYTLGATVGGGKNGVSSQAPAAIGSISAQAAAENYLVSVSRGGQSIFKDVSWGTLGGRAIFDANDPKHHMVRLLPPNLVVSTAAQTVGATANAEQLINGTLYYTDGSSESISITPTANTFSAVQAALNTFLDGSPVTVTELNDTDNGVDSGDTYRIQISAGAQNAGGKKLALMLVHRLGAFSNTALNAPEGGLRLFPGSVANVQPDIYKPGDKITVKVNTTILDPAGNTVDSAHNEISANAS